MEGSLVYNLPDSISINSYKGPYTVSYKDKPNILEKWANDPNSFFILDKNVLELHKDALNCVVSTGRFYTIDPNEDQKSLESFPGHVTALAEKQFKRNETLIAVGGGIVQDITCFLAANLFRGVSWKYIPTTLLSQADSCIGSKSSINVRKIKNIIGNFLPPSEIEICSSFLKTLKKDEIKSGIGEIIKIHIIKSLDAFANVKNDYNMMLIDHNILQKYIADSLLIKKSFIETDEFDKAERNVLNYGHTFGHAIEAATTFKIPHGIAVSIGMNLSNFFAKSLGFIEENDFIFIADTLRSNYDDYRNEPINRDVFFDAIQKDKKNEASKIAIIHLNQKKVMSKEFYPFDTKFKSIIESFFEAESMIFR